jgi:hypothetical protein
MYGQRVVQKTCENSALVSPHGGVFFFFCAAPSPVLLLSPLVTSVQCFSSEYKTSSVGLGLKKKKRNLDP